MDRWDETFEFITSYRNEDGDEFEVQITYRYYGYYRPARINCEPDDGWPEESNEEIEPIDIHYKWRGVKFEATAKQKEWLFDKLSDKILAHARAQEIY